jgi:hypothetical protein
MEHAVDLLRKSVVKILDIEAGTVVGSGFIIRADGYLATCHHVIYRLPSLIVEYQGEQYGALWCEEYSDPDKDIAILKIDTADAYAVQLIRPYNLSTSVTVYGFSHSKLYQFPEGYSVAAQHIQCSAPINTLATYSLDAPKLLEKLFHKKRWNKLPLKDSKFEAYHLTENISRGTSGGPVFADALGGVIGIIQSSTSTESYAIRWDNISDILDRLGIEPRKNTACHYLHQIENTFNKVKFFHRPYENVVLQEQYIPVEVTLERRYHHVVETIGGYAASEREPRRIYSSKEGHKDTPETQLDWKEAQQKFRRIMVLADPGMGKTTLLRMTAVRTAQQERQYLENLEKTVDDVVFPVCLRLAEIDEMPGEVDDVILQLTKRDYNYSEDPIISLLQEKLRTGKCLLLFDALDEVPRERRLKLAERIKRLLIKYPCAIVVTSRIVGYSNIFRELKEMEIIPLRQEQIEQYIKVWFKNSIQTSQDFQLFEIEHSVVVHEKSWKEKQAKELIHELQNKQQFQSLAQNPLLLSLLCSLAQTQQLHLPARRVDVYKQAIEYMLTKWNRNYTLASDGRVRAKLRILEELAYHFSCEGKEIFSADELYEKIEKYLKNSTVSSIFKDCHSDDLLREFSENDGLFQKLFRESDQYIFLHRTFQEYLTASYLNRVKNGIELTKAHFWEYD